MSGTECLTYTVPQGNSHNVFDTEVDVGLFFKAHQKHAVPRPHHKALRGAGSGARVPRFEQLESRQLLSVAPAPIHVGVVYFEDSSPHDQVGDVFEITFNGGAAGTQLAELRIDTDKMGDGLGMGDTFFDTAPGGLGAFGASPFAIVNRNGIDSVTAQVADGGTQLVLTFQGFDPGEKLVFSIDVDEQGFLEPNAVAEGAEFEGSKLLATFSAPHYLDAKVPEDIQPGESNMFIDAFDSSLVGKGLDLPNDAYNPPSIYMPPGSEPGPVYTAGVACSLLQTPLPITLSGTVFEDFNADNYRQTGEPGIGGVQLELYELVNGDYVSTGKTTTDAAGNYRFDELLPSTYRVVETQPNGYLSVGDTPGTVDGSTRGVVSTVDVLSSINLDGGEDSIHNDFAETRPAELSGHVYHDLNNNGVMDPGEEGIGGVQLALLDAYGLPTGATAATDAAGFYQFTNLMPGGYGIAEDQPAGYFDGLDAAGTAGGFAYNPGDLIDGAYLVGGQSGVSYDFGELLPASVSGFVYVDLNNNGVFEAGEAPIAGVQLALLDGQGIPTGQTATTDESGYYYFDNLLPGTYGIAEAQPNGYIDGLDTSGTAGGIAYNPGDLIDTIPLVSGMSAKQYNFGELLRSSIRGQVFADLDGNYIYDPSDRLLSNVTIYLLDSAGNRIASTTTDANGQYAFTDLIPGVYGVEEIQPANYLEGGDYVGSAGGMLDGPDRILGAVLVPSVDGVHYDFGEVVPAKISGYVFQDGPAITVKQGDPPPNIPALRDGKLTPDDKPLVGVVLQLCDASGSPLLDAHGNSITAVTDANGYYEFNMLRPDVYSIVEIAPSQYLPGIDTAGSKGGQVINSYTYQSIDPSILSMLAVDPSGNAIVQIQINPGDAAVSYNFSHVLLRSDPPGYPPEIPPGPPSPFLPPPVPTPFVYYRPMGGMYSMAPQIMMQPLGGGSGGPGGYSWHLSIIDAGQPRREAAGDQFADSPQSSIFDPVSWTGADLGQSQWILANEDGAAIQKFRFGMLGATPVTGDWDGSGTTKIGVFIDGLWFLDINGNGQWDEGDLWVKLGAKGDQPITGDWNGDGKTDVGIYGPAWVGDLKAVAVEPGLPDAHNRPAKARPKNVPPEPADAAVGYRTLKKGHVGKLRSDVIDHVFQYGTKGDVAVTGDWNGDGIYTVGIFRNGVWFLDMDGDGRWSEGDVMVEFGQEGDRPVVGDWTGDGISKLGVYRHGTFYLDANNNRQLDATDKVFELGGPGDKPVVGDWTGNGVDKVGVYQDGRAADVPLQASKK